MSKVTVNGTDMLRSELTGRRLMLRQAGFAPIPVNGKKPEIGEWQKKLNTTDAEIKQWELEFPHATNTGMLTRNTPTIDIDILTRDAAVEVEKLARRRFNSTLLRIGRPPKRAIPFRTDDPFPKITANLIAPDGSNGEKLEFLCDGQQVVVFGTHPSTGKPYRWHGDDYLDGEFLRHDQLPRIIQAEARAFVEDAVTILVDRFGYQRRKVNDAGNDGEPVDWDEMISNIISGTDLHDSILRLAASMAGKGMGGPHIKSVLRATMNASTASHDERWQERYDDIARSVDSAVEKYSDSWSDPKPLPSGLLPVAPYRSDYMPDALAGWIDDIAERLQCPPDYVAVTAMVALGTLIGRRVGIRPKQKDDWTEYANFWGLFTGPPGSMKSPAMRAALKPLHRLEIEAAKASEEAVKMFKAELEAFKIRKQVQASLIKDAMKKEAQKKEGDGGSIDVGPEPEAPLAVRYVTHDTSYESLGELLVANPNGLLIERDELISLLKYLDDEQHIRDRGFYMQGWSGTDMYTFDRIMRGHLHIPAVCIGMIGNTQPIRISGYVRRANRDGGGGDGLIQRFGGMIQPDEPLTWRNVDEYPDSKAQQQAWDVFDRVAKLTEGGAVALGAEEDTFNNPPFYRFDKSALGEFVEWHTDQKHLIRRGGLSPALAGHFEKYSKLVPALALINHLAGGGQGAISQLALRKALGYATYLETHARRVYGSANMVELLAARAILAHIAKGDLSDGFTMRDVHRPRWMNLSEHEWVQEGIELLLDYGYLAQKTIKTGGRPTVAYTINPKVKN